MERTLVICKPDAVERGLVGEVLSRLERKGLRLAAAELRHVDRSTAERHYEEHRERPFFAELVEFITRTSSLLLVLEGPEGTRDVVRTLVGATDPQKAAPGTIRGDFGSALPENLIHASDSEDSARREIELFFPGV